MFGQGVVWVELPQPLPSIFVFAPAVRIPVCRSAEEDWAEVAGAGALSGVVFLARKGCKKSALVWWALGRGSPFFQGPGLAGFWVAFFSVGGVWGRGKGALDWPGCLGGARRRGLSRPCPSLLLSFQFRP